MTDAHVHIERGPYTGEWIELFVEQAVKNNITELCLLEHTHRFVEFAPMYAGVISHDPYQAKWLSDRLAIHLRVYASFVGEMKRRTFPIAVKWGLEVCYFREQEDLISGLTGDCPELDFLTGSVHYIRDWGFDHKREFWEGRDVDRLYADYYRSMIELAGSGLFDTLAHPDSIKCFGHLPSADMTDLYDSLARTLSSNHVRAEYSAGLVNNYGHTEPGVNDGLLAAFKRHRVEMVTASDAHKPEDTGKNIARCVEKLRDDDG
jgi:histidinol-phosphatase (PHP family)